MTYVIRAYNRQGDPLSYGSFQYSGTLEWHAWCDEPDTVPFAVKSWKSGLRDRTSVTRSLPAEARYVRNRVAYFDVCDDTGYLIARANRSHPGWLDNIRESVRNHDAMIKAESAPEALSDAPPSDSAPDAVQPTSVADSGVLAQVRAMLPPSSPEDMVRRVARGVMWLDVEIPGWEDIIADEPGYSPEQLARIAENCDRRGFPAAMPWIKGIAEMKRERIARKDREETSGYRRAELAWLGDHETYRVKFTAGGRDTKWLSLSASDFRAVRNTLTGE